MSNKYLYKKNIFTRSIRIKLPPKEWFIEKYYKEKKSVYDIAEELNCSVNTIYRRLKYYKIERLNHSKSIAGDRHPMWKGGRRKSCGYIKIYKPNHPNADKHHTVFEHRLIVEKKLGRYLTKDEVVHHLNGIRDDNRVENLIVMKNHCEHGKEEGRLKKEMRKRIQVLEDKIKKLKDKK